MQIRVGSLAGLLVLAACASQAPTETVARARPTGAETFATHCASCHGRLAEGDGPVAAAISGTVPNLRTLSQRNGGEFPADAVASYIDGSDLPAAHGERLMPVWGPIFDATARIVADAETSQQRIAAVVEYLRSIQY
jgi:mono/diheme cytochrome c family protein